MRPIRAIAATTAIVAVAIAATPAQARDRGFVPRAGDWDGVGAHGLPLSFDLVRRHGLLVATSIALGSPASCPANERDADAVSLSGVTYAGPGGAPAAGGSAALLSGRVPGGSTTASLTGSFTSPTAGAFSIQVTETSGTAGCGWPAGTLAWQVHPATRRMVADGTWSAALRGRGIARGELRLVVVGGGRVVNSLSVSFRCQTARGVYQNSVKASPAYEFIRAGGDFYSPETGNPGDRHATTWSGRFHGRTLSGALSVYDVCTRKLARARFVGGLIAPATTPPTKPGSRRGGRRSRRSHRR